MKAQKSDSYKRAAPFYLEFHRRLSLPAVCLVLILLGPPLSLLAGRSGRLGGLAIGLFVFTAYYLLLIYGENLVLSKKLPHYAGAWSPMIILAASALFTHRKANSV